MSTGAFVLLAGASLAACGSDDSSASSTPSFTSSATSAAVTTAPSSTPQTSSTSSTSVAPTSPGAAATAPEQAEPVPSGFPGPTEAANVDARGQAFLGELKAKGVTVAGNGEIAISTANYICAAKQQGVPNDQISTFVTANVGSEAAASGTEITAEQAGATAQTYIDAASAKYCS
ncbi:DUF732 domain-containing protein [Actinomycetes bacterium M1A6_2h]